MLLLEGFFVDDVRHLADISAIVLFQNVNQTLHAAARHPFIRIGRKTRDSASAGKVVDARVRHTQDFAAVMLTYSRKSLGYLPAE